MGPRSGRLPSPAAGLGLRRCHLERLAEAPEPAIDFYEVAPENWMRIGGRLGRLFRAVTERERVYAHGLSLSLGGTDPLDRSFLGELKTFLDVHGICGYSEHLSYSSLGGHLYDLMPLPFTEAALRHVVRRIGDVQDFLGQRLAIENVSYYAAPWAEMSELDFLKGVLDEIDCDLLLDVNNVFVNSVNHGYDPRDFIRSLPPARIVGLHVAGHYVEQPNLLIDTHGAALAEEVWQLLDDTYAAIGTRDTLLERDFNIPPLPELIPELERIRALQDRHPPRLA